jgi:hypothetical protein
MGEDSIIAIRTVHGQMEAEILKALLESAGIDVLLSQEGAGTVLGLTIGPLGDVDLLVRESQAADARALLEEYGRGSLDSGTAEDTDEPAP